MQAQGLQPLGFREAGKLYHIGVIGTKVEVPRHGRQIETNLALRHDPNRKTRTRFTAPEIPPMTIRFAATLRLLETLSLGIVLSGFAIGQVRAEDSAEPARVRPTSATSTPAPTMVSPGEATPEMWFYEQALRQYNDPKNAVRANAEFKANARRQRIAAMEWYGYSNSRPSMGIDPLHGPQQAQWVGNGGNPQWWVAPAARPMVIVDVPGPGAVINRRQKAEGRRQKAEGRRQNEIC